jgi:hypothetical protein
MYGDNQMTDRHDELAKQIVAEVVCQDEHEHCEVCSYEKKIAAALRAEASKRVVGYNEITLINELDKIINGEMELNGKEPSDDLRAGFVAGFFFCKENLTLAEREACGCELVLPPERIDIGSNGELTPQANWFNSILRDILNLNPSLKVREGK